MTNKVRGESEFLAGTERYVMRLTLGALAEIENGLGVSSLSDIANKLKSLGTMDLATVASALLRGAGHDLSPADVLKLETDLGTLVGSIPDASDAVGLSHANNAAQAKETSGPLAGTSSSPPSSA